MSRNAEIAGLLEEFADRLDAKGVDYKPRAYRRAAENLRNHTIAVEALVDKSGQEGLEEIEGVGEAISSKILAYLETGEIAELEELRDEMPADVDALTRVEGVGPKTVKSLYDALGVETLDDLERAASEGQIREISGFGAKTEQNILENIEFARESHRRELLGDTRPVGETVIDHLGGVEAVDTCDLAGSLRRWRPTVGDVDVLAASDDPERVVSAFADWERATDVIEAGTGKASIRIEELRVDLRVVAPDEFGSALQYFTGSKDHNVHLRNVAIDRDLKMNEYGVFDISGVEEPDAGQRIGDRIAGGTEESMYDALDLPWIAPELREDRGEIEAARDGALPDLLSVEDVRGDLHVHTNWSDGNATIAEMVRGAARFGHDYVAITDHATGPGMVGGVGLDDEDLREQMAEVRAVAEAAAGDVDGDGDVNEAAAEAGNESAAGNGETDIDTGEHVDVAVDFDGVVDVLAGVEANIDADGGISVGNDVLADLDLVVASPHSGLDGDGTDRLVAAAEHPHVDVIGHPTGRMLNQRTGLDIDVETLAEAAAENDVALEVNANPSRLDLSGAAVKTAIDRGVPIVIDTDAHRPSNYEYIRYGVHTARRGWAEPDDVLTTRGAADLREFLDD